MKREETYCDSCGHQMSYQDSDGNTDHSGILLFNYVSASAKYKHSCGTSSAAFGVHGTHFCSYSCFEKELNTFLLKIKEYSLQKETQ